MMIEGVTPLHFLLFSRPGQHIQLFCVMIFVLKSHCPMMIVKVIFHQCDSMLRIVGDESFSRHNGRAGIMPLFGGVANHTPQGLV
jgi:hypothetical protein